MIPRSVLRKIRYIPEALLFSLILCVVPLLPRRAVCFLADRLGDLGFRVCRRFRRVALANLDLALGEGLSDARKDEIVRQSFRTGVLVALDLVWFGFFMKQRLAKYVSFDSGFEQCFRPGAFIAVTGHLGNWEVMGKAASLRGVVMNSVAMPLGNSFLNRMLNRFRRGTGQEVVPRAGAVRKLITMLKTGRHVALLMDQNTLPEEGGGFVPFFGLPVPVSRAVGKLSERTGADVFCAFCIPEAGGSYLVRVLPSFDSTGREKKEEEITRWMVGVMEDQVRLFPEFWLWFYRRWKFIPEGESPEKYPFYSRTYGPNDN